jgi:hypothetical protein
MTTFHMGTSISETNGYRIARDWDAAPRWFRLVHNAVAMAAMVLLPALALLIALFFASRLLG